MKILLFLSFLLCQLPVTANTPAETFIAALSADDTDLARKTFINMPDQGRIESLQLMFDTVEVGSYAQEVRNFLSRFLASPINVAPNFWAQLKVTHKWKHWIEQQHKLKQVAHPLHVKSPHQAKKEREEKHMNSSSASASATSNTMMTRFDTALAQRHLSAAFHIIDDLESAHNDTTTYIYKMVKQQWNHLETGEHGSRMKLFRHFLKLSAEDKQRVLQMLREDPAISKEAVLFFEGKTTDPRPAPAAEHKRRHHGYGTVIKKAKLTEKHASTVA
jgi:hypothetical protein